MSVANVVSDALTALMGLSESIERPMVLEILPTVHSAASTLGYSCSLRTDPRLDQQDSSGF
jgi:hypothetical protein